MNGHHVHALLRAAGATLRLDPQGNLRVTPSHVSRHYRTAITAHLCDLLVCAAVDEVKRALEAHGIPCTHVGPRISEQMLNAACLSGNVDMTRQAATTYVREWTHWLKGERAGSAP